VVPFHLVRPDYVDRMRELKAGSVPEAIASLAELAGVSTDAIRRAVPYAIAEIEHVPTQRDAALVAALSRRLGRLTLPLAIHYFHGTRVIAPDLIGKRGLLPHAQILSTLWAQLGELARPEVTPADWRALRQELDDGCLGPSTYLRPPSEIGPFGLLIRDVFLEPQRWHSVDYLRSPESVADICAAAHDRFGVDLAEAYEEAALPCIVEFAAVAGARADEAVASTAWYIEGARRGEPSLDALHAFDGRGTAVPPEAIVTITLVDD
jgi:hypothetical protein